MNRLGVSPVLHRALPGGGERRLGGGDACTEPLGAEGDEVVVEVAARVVDVSVSPCRVFRSAWVIFMVSLWDCG